MKPTLCSRCKKNLAVIFITKIENGNTVNEGLCLKCARELGIKPVDDLMQRMGITDDDLENLSGEMSDALGGLGMIASQQEQPDSDEDDEEQEIELVTTLRQNALKGLISKESPVGKAVMGHKTGDRVLVAVNPDYSYYIQIRKVVKGTDDESLPISAY